MLFVKYDTALILQVCRILLDGAKATYARLVKVLKDVGFIDTAEKVIKSQFVLSLHHLWS